MSKKTFETLLNILFGTIGIAGIGTLIFDDFNKNHPYLFAAIIILILLSIIVLIRYRLFEKEQTAYMKLENLEHIVERIKEYADSKSFPNLTLYGKFDENIIAEIYNTSKANGSSLSQSVTLISSDYGNMRPDLTKKIIDSEAGLCDCDFSHKFYGFKQHINVFKASNVDNNYHVILLFWKKNENDYVGVEILNSGYDININEIQEYAFSMNINNGQKDVVENTLNDIAELWKPLKDGFFSPVLPPIANKLVREEWRKAILQNFNDFALKLIKSEEYENMKITWNLTMNSLVDYKNFEEWINNQFNITNKASDDDTLTFSVTRYFLIDSKMYNEDADYKDIVTKISKIFHDKNNGSKGVYKLRYVDSRTLKNTLKNDYAYLTGTAEIIQSSYIDKKTDTEVLKVYFSKSNDAVTKVKNKFDELESKSDIIFNSLSVFEKSLTV